jgi:hypothetical protein
LLLLIDEKLIKTTHPMIRSMPSIYEGFRDIPKIKKSTIATKNACDACTDYAIPILSPACRDK